MNYLGKFPHKIQKQIQHIADILSPYTSRAYLVGGCVRDIFLDNDIYDLDIEVYDIAPQEFDEIMSKIGAHGVGKSFFVYKYGKIDLALPRVERKVGVGHKAYEVEVCQDEKLASSRRDFSMNAMMINIFDGELLDFWDGAKSCEQKEISIINEIAFKEDSLRVLRAIQFAARFDMKIEEKSLEVMQQIELSDLSKTRILWEFEKLFIAKYLHVGLFYMYKLSIFEKIFTCMPDETKIQKALVELEKAQSGFVEELRAYYFVYIVSNIFGCDGIAWLKDIEAPNHYLKALKDQVYFDRLPSDKELATIAVSMPIKRWLGNYKDNVVERAKELGIYEELYTRGVTIADVIKDGFEKADIKKEYLRRIKEKLESEFS